MLRVVDAEVSAGVCDHTYGAVPGPYAIRQEAPGSGTSSVTVTPLVVM
jgi:hypothetical protein